LGKDCILGVFGMCVYESPQLKQIHGSYDNNYEYLDFKANYELIGFVGSIATSDEKSAERIERVTREWIQPLKSAMSWGKYLFGGKK